MPEARGGHGLAALSAEAMLAGYRRGDFTPSEVIEDVIARLVAVQGSLNVVAAEMFDAARQEAAAATQAWSQGAPTGPLCGVPVTVKDLIYVRGVRGAAGSVLLKDFVTPADAAPVERLRRAGAIITCKTTTCESGYKLTADSPLTGVTRNPWRPDRTSGGSSGGAAAAVAAGAGPLALGTDGVGSIRVPASFCGVFGLKPTFGRVPRGPGFGPPPWASLAHTGPIARTVADAALALGIISGYDARDPASFVFPPAADAADVATLRIGVSPDLGYAPTDPDVAAAFAAAVARLADQGLAVAPAPIALDADSLEGILKPIAFTEQAAAAAGRSPQELALSEKEFRAVVDDGGRTRGVDYVAAGYRRGAMRETFRALFDDFDVLLTPTVAVTAFAAGTLGVDRVAGHAVDGHLGWSPFTWPMNLSGLPAATVPCGFDRDGLPIGMQIVAPWFREDRILALAAFFEGIAPWAEARPAEAAILG